MHISTVRDTRSCVRVKFESHPPKINDAVPHRSRSVSSSRFQRRSNKERWMRAHYLRVNTETKGPGERRRARRKGAYFAREPDGYLLKQLRVLITYDYKFNRTSFVIIASARERITSRDISFCHTGLLRCSTASFIIFTAKVAKPPNEDYKRECK